MLVDTLRRRTVDLPDGTRLAVQEAGPVGAPVLLLLSGQANSHDWWTGLRSAFEDSFTTLTFDYRGTGESRAVEGDWSTALFAQDAQHVLEASGVEAAHVYGTSMGGRVGQMLAARSPHLVDRLVLACTTPGGAGAVERGQDVRRALSQPDRAARRQVLLDLMYTPGWARPGRRSHLLGDPTMTPRAQTLHLRASARHDASQRLAEIASPTLVVHGDADRMSPVENAFLLEAGIPDCDVWIHEGGRHGFFDEFAGEVSARVLEFLAA